MDPFTLQAGKRSGPLEVAESLPQVDATNLVSYLVLQTNIVTVKQLLRLTISLSADASRKSTCGQDKDNWTCKYA